MALWDQINSTGTVEDRRGASPAGLALGGGSALAVMGVYLVLSFLGINVDPSLISSVLGGSTTPNTQVTDTTSQYAGTDAYETFTSKVLGSTNDYWKTELPKAENMSYKNPTLVLFRSATQTGCGVGTTDVGPFYCPEDSTIYLDETFFDTIKQLGGSSSDFAQAYVIAHEVGHNVQNIVGITGNGGSSNAQSVEIELQADCFAGLWAGSVKNIMQPGDIENALQTASSVGDDHIQQTTQGVTNPESWTHGSSSQRVAAFKTGYETGDYAKCKSYTN